MTEKVDLRLPKQWEAKPEDEIKIPEVYVKELKFEIVVFTKQKDFTFRCREFYAGEGGAWSFEGVIIDSSKRDPMGEVTLKRLTYHPIISLANVGFMVVPAPEVEGS